MPKDLALKILSDDANGMRIGGYAIAFGGADLVGDRFTPRTRLSLTGELGSIPILWGHGQDETMKTTLLGHTVSAKADDFGLWVEGVITAGKEYAEALRKIFARSKLGFSSGSVPHLVRRKSIGDGLKEILEWPIVELSCVPNPCEPRLLNVSELKSLALYEPSLRQFVRGALKEAGGTSLQEASYEDLQGDLRDAAAEALGVPYGVCVCATYPDHVIVSVESDMDMPGQPDDEEDSVYWDFPYTIGSDGEPVLGKPVPVQQAFVAGAAKAALTSNARNNLSAGQFAYTDSSGTGHLPINDAAHVRAAMSRFNQTSFESPAKRKAAARKILARARALGIDITPDSSVANAAKDGGIALTDLPDSAFALVEDGKLDDTKTTFTRNRYWPHHDESGDVDHEMLRQAVKDSHKAHAPSSVIAHLKLHALFARLHDDPPEHDEAHTKKWAGKAPSELLAIGLEIVELASEVADQHEALGKIGTDTKNGERILPELAQRLGETETRLHRVLDWAKTVDRGADGRARVNRLRTELQLMEV